MSGFVGGYGCFFTGAFQALKAHPAGIMLVILAILSTLLTLVYTFLTGFKIFFGPLKMDSDHIKDPPLTMSLPILFLAILAIVLGIYPEPVLRLLSLVVTGI
jgi:NADH:ubiquinone oxidoreductase subunit 5 (subunit L)/multisubunit Na+/H+ antiporter MnhA subunit